MTIKFSQKMLMVGAFCLLLPGSVAADGLSKVEKRLEKAYPKARYVTAVGLSEVGVEQAEALARAGVSSQIRSELSAVLSTVESESVRDGKRTEFQEIVARTESKTFFKHAELIINDRKLSGREGRAWIAVAVLNRDETARVFQQEYDAFAMDFRSAAGVLKREASDVAVWTTTLRRAENAYERMMEVSHSIRALKRVPERLEEDEALHASIQSERGRRLAAVRLALRVESSNEDAGPLVAFLGQALSTLGLESRSEACPETGFVLRVNPEFRWESGMLGPVIRLSLPGQLIRCEGEQAVGRIILEDRGGFVGADVRDRQRALANLWSHMDEVLLSRLLRDELSRYLPVARL